MLQKLQTQSIHTMTNRFIKTLLWTAAATSLALTSCKKEDEPEPNEGELITTVTLSLTKAGSSTPVTITFKDVDGPGGAAPTITPATLVLDANAVYTSSLTFLDESVSPAKDIAKEVGGDESDEHEAYLVASNGLNLTVSGRNLDKNRKPLGTKATITSAAASQGTLTVTLKHKPLDEFPAKTDSDSISKGETDIEVTFPVQVK